MKIHRFFVEQQLPAKGAVTIEHDDLVHQWRNVLRFQVGQEVILYDNSGSEFYAVVTGLTNRAAEVSITKSVAGHFAPKRAVSLFLALPKRDSFEWTLEKGTELGVAAFVPVVSERSEKKTVNVARSKLLLKEACEQSGRAQLPLISEPAPLAKILENLAADGGELAHTFVLDPTGAPFSLARLPVSSQAAALAEHVSHINVFVGPEGGFSPTELELFASHGVPAYSFSSQTLRAETAAVAIAAVLLLNF